MVKLIQMHKHPQTDLLVFPVMVAEYTCILFTLNGDIHPQSMRAAISTIMEVLHTYFVPNKRPTRP